MASVNTQGTIETGTDTPVAQSDTLTRRERAVIALLLLTARLIAPTEWRQYIDNTDTHIRYSAFRD